MTKKPYALRKCDIQNLILHHNKEIKRLINSDELYKHENVLLLKKELEFFVSQLEIGTNNG